MENLSFKTDTTERETGFHDRWAESVDVADVPVTQVVSACTSPELQWIFERLGDLKGLRVLELGAGLGEAAVNFALRGAEVHATDVSTSMLNLTASVARHHNTTVHTQACTADDLSPFASESFDIVYAANTLHHVSVDRCVPEVHRVLKPGGRFAFWDPLAYNPVINVYRRMAGEVRTVDEHPLRRSDLQAIATLFPGLSLRFYWLTTLMVFLKFYFIDRVHPNADRYWKRILTHESSLRWMYLPLARFDQILLAAVPPLRWWCWNVAGVAQKPL